MEDYVLKSVCCIITWIVSLSLSSVFAETGIATRAPLKRIKEGEVLAFQCQVWNPATSQSVIISRHTEDIESETITWEQAIVSSIIDDRFFLAMRNQDDGSVIYFLMINYASRRDYGTYYCDILDKSAGRYILQDSQTIEVNYLPNSKNPFCSPTSTNDLTVSPGSLVTFNCTSEAAKPQVSFEWSRVSDGTIDSSLMKDAGSSDGTTAYSELTFKVKYDDIGAVFLCTIKSEAFPEFSKTCFVGPLVYESKSTDIAPSDGNVNTTQSSITEVTNVKKCNIECSVYEQESLMWMIAFAFSIVLSTVLLMWILGMYKRLRSVENTGRSVSASTLRRPSSLAVSGEEDFYIEMSNKSNKSGGDEGRMYMTLEKPRMEYMPYPGGRQIDEDNLSFDTGDNLSASGFSQYYAVKGNI